MFVCYSGDLIVHLWQGGRGRVSGSEVISCSHLSNISVGAGSVLSRCRPEGMWCDVALRMMARKIFSPFWQLGGIRLLLNLSSISLLYRVDSDVHLQTNEDLGGLSLGSSSSASW